VYEHTKIRPVSRTFKVLGLAISILAVNDSGATVHSDPFGNEDLYRIPEKVDNFNAS
jgi:hypothetical protein